MTGQKWTIHWNDQAADTYLYGSRIQFNKKTDIVFENPLMPPGTIIKRWYSKTNFQLQHIEPSLPIIDGETEYEITPNIEYLQGGTCILRLEFFDKYEESVGFLNVRNEPTRFRCPLKTYSYQMQLMNAGASVLRFHWVILKEVMDGHE